MTDLQYERCYLTSNEQIDKIRLHGPSGGVSHFVNQETTFSMYYTFNAWFHDAFADILFSVPLLISGKM